MTSDGARIRRTRWWNTAGSAHAVGGLYVVLGGTWLVQAVADDRQGGYAFGPLLLVAGALTIARGRPVLRGGVIQVPARAVGRRRIAVPDIEVLATPHPFDVATRPSAVLRSGERVLLRDVDDSLLRAWSVATGIPVVRDPKPRGGTGQVRR